LEVVPWVQVASEGNEKAPLEEEAPEDERGDGSANDATNGCDRDRLLTSLATYATPILLRSPRAPELIGISRSLSKKS
jgi:hypothetical protein